ncbi:MAG: PilZ domain-containing protein [Candidatus Omnitrophota bacterium]
MVLKMAELRYGQLFVADTAKTEFCGKVLAVRNEKTYEIAVMSEEMAWPIVSESCTVYYQGPEQQRRVFSGILIPEGPSTLVLKQTKTATTDKRKYFRLKTDGMSAIMQKERTAAKTVLQKVWAVLKGGKKSIKVQVFDICEDGVGILSPVTLPLKEKFLVEVNLNDDKIPAIGGVRYCAEKENLFVAGLEFWVISEEARKKLRRFVSRELQRKGNPREEMTI